jgi:transporter family-2 protein
MQTPALLLAGALAGAALAAQGPILNRLAAFAGGPIQAAMVAFAIGLAALTLACLAAGAPLPRPGAVARMPLWLWASGLIGTALLLLTLHAVPRTGVAPFTAAVLSGQVLAALLWDRIGLLGLAARPLGAREALGAALLLAGLFLLARRG